MISLAGQWTQSPSATPLQPIKWNASFWIVFTSDDQPGWLMDSNPICHLSPAKKMKCSFLYYIQLLMLARLVDGLKPHPPPLSSQKSEMLIFVLHSTADVGQTGKWTWTSSTTPLQPIKWNAHILIMFNFWWLAGLVNGLKHHPPPLSSQKKWNAHFWIMFNFWWSAWLTDELQAHLPPLSYQKNEMLIYQIHSTSDDQPGWSMDSNPICHPSPTKKMKCSFLDYVQLLMISWAGQWTQTPSATPLQPKKWNPHFCITFNFWWSDRLVNGLQPHLPPLSSQKNEMLLFGLRSTSDDQLGWLRDSNPILHLSPAKEMKCSFLYYVQLLMIGWAGRWTQSPSTTPLQPKKWNAHFCSTFNIWCWPDWSMDLNLIHHPSPANKMKCSFLGYIQLLMISQAGRWTQTLSATPLLPKKWNAYFWIMFNFWWSARLVDELKPHSPPLSSQKNEMLIFGLCSTSHDLPG